MADPGLFNTLFDDATKIANRGKEAITSIIKGAGDSVENIEKIIQDSVINNGAYQFTSNAFPEDLGSSYYGHYMTLTAYEANQTFRPTPTAPTGALGDVLSTTSLGAITNPRTPVYTVAIFMPSTTGQGAGPVFMDNHEYSDIKLTNILQDKIGIQGVNALGGVRRAINPAVQVLYRSTDLREFQFAFLMAPKSEKESQAVEEIVKQIRRFSAPINSGLTFRFPSEWEIKFYNKDSINPHLPKIKRCIIKNITANYAPQGEWSTFRNGYPVATYLQFDVREMEIITRSEIEGGF